MKKLKKSFLFYLTILFSMFISAKSVFAQEYSGLKNPVIGEALGSNPDAAKSGEIFVNYFITIWNVVISIGGLIVLVFFAWGSIEWITAEGDATKIQKARARMTQAVIGLVLLVSSFTIISFISYLFFGDNFSILNLNFQLVPTE